MHGAAQRVGDGVVDGGGDQRVDELEVGGSAAAGAGVGGGEDTGAAQPLGAADGVVVVEGGELGHQADGDVVAEDGGGPGEPGGVYAEFLQPGDEPAAPGGAVQRAQFTGVRLDGFESAVLDLGEELHGLVGVAARDGPHLAAEGGVRVLAEGGAGEAGRGGRGQRAEHGDRVLGRGGDGVQVRGAHPADVARPAGDHDENGQIRQVLREGGEPVQGLLVGPVGVVDRQDQRPVPAGQPAHGGDQALADALRVGVPVAGLGYAEGGAGDVVPVAEVLAGLLRQHRHQRGLEELAHDVERDGAQGLAAAGRPHGAAALFGDAPGLGEQRGLAQPRLAPQHQQAAG